MPTSGGECYVQLKRLSHDEIGGLIPMRFEVGNNSLLQLPPNGPKYCVHSVEGDLVVYREVGEGGLPSPKVSP